MIPAALLNVCIDRPSMPIQTTKHNFSVATSLTPAQITAGTNIIGPGHESSLRFLGGTLIIGAAALTGVTLLRVVTTDATPVVLAQFAVADLTANAKYGTTSTQFVLGAGFLATLARGVGIKVDKTGGSAAGSTTATFVLNFDIVG